MSSSLRSLLYTLAKFLGDFSALSSGKPDKMVKRAGRRVVGKAVGKSLWKLFK